MRIQFGFNKSPKESLDKVVVYSEGGDREGSLVSGTSILKPKILFQGGEGAFVNVNYFYVEDFGRYYFITGIETVRTGLVQIEGRVDVMSTYKAYIRTNSAIFRNLQQRNATLGFNKMINDGTFQVYQDRYVINKFEFPVGFYQSEYVLAMAGS